MTLIKDTFFRSRFVTDLSFVLSLSRFVFELTLLLYDKEIEKIYTPTAYQHLFYSRKTSSRPSSFCFSFFSGTTTWQCSSNTNPSSAKRSSIGE